MIRCHRPYLVPEEIQREFPGCPTIYHAESAMTLQELRALYGQVIMPLHKKVLEEMSVEPVAERGQRVVKN